MSRFEFSRQSLQSTAPFSSLQMDKCDRKLKALADGNSHCKIYSGGQYCTPLDEQVSRFLCRDWPQMGDPRQSPNAAAPASLRLAPQHFTLFVEQHDRRLGPLADDARWDRLQFGVRGEEIGSTRP